MIKNTNISVGINKKLIQYFKDPYVIHTFLPNDRFVIKDIEEFQHTQVPYEGVISSDNLRHWVKKIN